MLDARVVQLFAHIDASCFSKCCNGIVIMPVIIHVSSYSLRNMNITQLLHAHKPPVCCNGHYSRDDWAANACLATCGIKVHKHVNIVEQLCYDEICTCIYFGLEIHDVFIIRACRIVWMSFWIACDAYAKMITKLFSYEHYQVTSTLKVRATCVHVIAAQC